MSADGLSILTDGSVELDALLTPSQCAKWFQQSERWLGENADKIIAFKPTRKVKVYHPRSVLSKMAFDAGIPVQLIAASFGIQQKENQ